MNQKKSLVAAIVVAVLFWTVLVFAHGGHGDADAEKLWSTTNTPDALTYTPEKVDPSTISFSSYTGVVTSDNYGSIFSSQEGIIADLSVQLWDTVKKWQVVAHISRASNTPEMISLLADRKSAIAIAEGKKLAANKVKAYIETQVNNPNNNFQNAYDQKRKAIELGYETRSKQLTAEIESAKAQAEAKKKTIGANKKSSQAIIDSSDQKILAAQKELQGAVESSLSILAKIFYGGNTGNLRANWNEINRFLTSNSSGLNSLQQKIRQFIALYDVKNQQYTDLVATAQAADEAIKQWLEVINYAVVTSDYTNEQLQDDKKTLIDLVGGESGIWVTLHKVQQIQKEAISTGALGEAGVSQAEADIVSLDQQVILLGKEFDQLDAEKQKDLATATGDQFVQSLDLQKMLNEAERDSITADAEVLGNQRALSAVMTLSTQIPIFAPFNGVISRKNVTVGQAIQGNTPIYDIVGDSKDGEVFIKSEIPVGDIYKIRLGKSITVTLPGAPENSTATIKRIAQSVNQVSQTLSFESIFSEKIPYPLWTQVRVMPVVMPEALYKIPSHAIFEENGKVYVWKVLPDKTIKKWQVEILKMPGEEFVLVLSGLTESSVVISDSDWQAWVDWQKLPELKALNS